MDFLRLAQLFFLFLKENVSFLQKTDQIFTVSQILSDFRGKVILFHRSRKRLGASPRTLL